MYNINFRLLADRLISWFIRPARANRHIIYSFLKPLQELLSSWLVWKSEMEYEANMTGQVIYLEKLLNDKFNAGFPAFIFEPTTLTYEPILLGTQTSIYIVDEVRRLPENLIYNEIEARPSLDLYNDVENHKPDLELYNAAEYDSQADFNVMIPAYVGDVNNSAFATLVSAWINKYKQAGTRFKLINY